MLFLVGYCPFYPFYQKVITRKFWLLLCKSRCLRFLSHKMTSSVVNQAKRYMWGGQPFSSWPFIKVSFQGQYIKAEVWDFPVMTEWMRLISYLLYGLSSTILKKNTIKPPEVIFHICLRALWLSSSPIRKQYLYASFLSVIENLVVLCPSFCCFRARDRSFFSQLKRAVEPGKFFIMLAQQPIRVHVLL